jgi:glycosyltransferase involved in cell wall biosynthesis
MQQQSIRDGIWSQMKILFVIPYIPSLVRVRPYQIIKHLKEVGHFVTLATISTNKKDEDDLTRIREFCDEVIAVNQPTFQSFLNCIIALPTKMPLQAVYSWDTGLFSLLKNHIWKNCKKPTFDIIHIEHLRGSQYGVRLKNLNWNSVDSQLPPIVWDSVDCISFLFKQASEQSQQSFKRVISKFELNRTEYREEYLTNLFDQVLVTSEKDKNALLDLISPNNRKIEVIPNGVDLAYFTPGNFASREKNTLVISGKMSYHANVNMVLFLSRKVMPLVWASHPEVKLWIVGKDPVPEICELAQLSMVNVTGTVDSILPYLQNATVSVAPIQYGAGIQNKVLEAMACATPVIASPLATSALNVKDGKEVIVADSPDDWATKILELINSPEKQLQIGINGRSYVEENHQWKRIVQDLEKIYKQTISKNDIR